MKNKSSKGRVQVIAGMLLFVLALLAEMYVMINEPMQYILIAVLGALTLGCVYIAVNGFLVMHKERSSKSDEQNGYIYKSGKASFLVSKKNFEEIGAKLSRMEKTSQVPAKEIVNAQKGIAKVIMNHNRENIDALMDSNNSMAEQLKAMAERLNALTQAVAENRDAIDANRDAVNAVVSASQNAVIESQEKISGLNEKALQAQEQGLIAGLKEMELRISNAIVQLQEAAQESMQQAPIASAAVEPAVQPSVAKEAAIETDTSDTSAEELLGVDAIFADAEDALAGLVNKLPELALDSKELPESGSDLTLEEEYAPEPELMSEPEVLPESGNDMSLTEELTPEPEVIAEVVPESESDMSLMEELTPESEVVAEVEAMPEQIVEPEILGEPPAPSAAAEPLTEEPEPEVIAEPIEKEIPAMPDLSDPNKALTLDEIDALFANMGVEVPETKIPSEPEPVFMPDVIMDSDLFDESQNTLEPNVIEELTNMSEPEIPPEAKAEEAAAEPEELPDSNKPLSLSEIDELLASMGVGDLSTAEPAAEPELIPEPEPIREAKPAMPDLSDPNKAMSADDIAALFANLA